MYLYVFEEYTYTARSKAKVGISKNPENRIKHFRRSKSLSLYKKWLMPSEKDARALERKVCEAFNGKGSRKEFINADPELVKCFIEKEIKWL